MKTSSIIKMAAVVALSFGTISSAYAVDKAAVKEVYSAKKDSILTIKGIMKINVSMNGKIAQSQEAPIISNGVTVGKNLVLAAYTTIKPKVKAPNQPGLSIDAKVEELKFIDASGEEFDAKIVLHDEDLGLAFLALDPKAENAAEFKATAIDISKDVEATLLDDLVGISRLDSSLRYTTALNTVSISSVLKKPRRLYLGQGVSPSVSYFTTKGEFFGIAIGKPGPSGKKMTPAIIPAKYAAKLLKQATEKAAALAK